MGDEVRMEKGKGVGLVSRSVDLVDDVDNLRVRTSALGAERLANLQFKLV